MTDRNGGNGERSTRTRPVWHGPAGGFLDRFLHGSPDRDAPTPAGTDDPARRTDAAHDAAPRTPAGPPPAGRDPSTAAATEAEASPEAPAEMSAAETDDTPAARLRGRVIEVLRDIYDPEIPVNLYDLGLIYAVETTDDGDVSVTMTLTTPHCPVAESMPYEVEARILGVEGVRDVAVHLVWDPPWDMSMMSDEARLELGLI